MKSFFQKFAAAFCICLGIGQLRAQTADTDPTATITFANNQSVVAGSDGRVFQLVGLQPNETVNVKIQFSADKIGHMLWIEPRDGGSISNLTNPVSVAPDATVSFQFQAGQSPGRYQISLHDGAEEIGLEFWVLDLANPQNNPPVLSPSNPNT